MSIEDFILEDGASELIDELFIEYDGITDPNDEIVDDEINGKKFDFRREIVKQIIEDWEAKKENAQ